MRTAAALAALLVAAAAPAAAVEWRRLSDVEQVEVVTTDEDGDVRETTVWLVVVDGEGYIRTGNTRWGSNLVRHPRVMLRAAGEEYALHAEFVQDEARRAAVVDAFRAKYGFVDRLLSVFRGSSPKIMHLVERTPPSEEDGAAAAPEAPAPDGPAPD